MTNWLVFHGSCGHIEWLEIDDVQWASMTRPDPQLPTRVGRKNRAVYVHPHRFCLCSDCSNQELMEAGHA